MKLEFRSPLFGPQILAQVQIPGKYLFYRYKHVPLSTKDCFFFQKLAINAWISTYLITYLSITFGVLHSLGLSST